MNNMGLYVLLILFGVFISSLSNVLLKKAALQHYDSKIREYLNSKVIIAYTIFFGATFLSVLAYKVVPLSMGVVLETTSYIYVTVLGRVFFHEKLNLKKMVALILIILGIIIYAYG